ncbi:MAG: lasso RiPP family leader peptide-containing protein [Hydrogenophaga sp.]|nr:lasso RiPP family leader peptide-containing protein [Hydrogenophaga sp.]
MKTAKSQLPTKKPYVAPVLLVHGDLRSLTQSGSAGKTETLGLPIACLNIKTRRC